MDAGNENIDRQAIMGFTNMHLIHGTIQERVRALVFTVGTSNHRLQILLPTD